MPSGHDVPTSHLPVADPWFTVEHVGDGISHITEPHVHRLLRCNVWHVRGRDRDLVIDTGLGLAALAPHVASERQHPVLAVATHGHADHLGGMHEFPHRAIHRSEAQALHDAWWSLAPRHFGDNVIGPYRDAGYDIPGLLIDAVPPDGPPPLTGRVAPAPATTLLSEGDVIDCGDRAFEVLHLPGHSPGSIGLWEPATGTLFSGDAIYDGPLLDRLDGSDIDAYLTTMHRLRALPVTVVHGGHEASFGRDRLVELCDAYLGGRAGG